MKICEKIKKLLGLNYDFYYKPDAFTYLRLEKNIYCSNGTELIDFRYLTPVDHDDETDKI
jgi:hypothetical protein